MSDMTPIVQVVRYQLSLLTEEDGSDWYVWNLYVEHRGGDRWAVTYGIGNRVLSHDNTWAWESGEDRNNEAWLRNHRYTMEEAIERASAMLPTVKINGKTAADIRAKRLLTYEAGETFVCPECGAESWNPNDRKHGYCGRCHKVTGVPQS